MKTLLRNVLLIFIFLSFTGNSFQRIDYTEGISNNVCKKLEDNVLIYFIFVDSQQTLPWTEFDIRTTIDSLKAAIKWIEQKAQQSGVTLNIIQDYYMGDNYATIKRELPRGNVFKSLTEPNLPKGITSLNEWADYIAKKAGANFNLTGKDGIPEIKNPKNKERLVAYLRDQNHVESVGLLYMINNYFKNDISVALNTMNTENMEYAIVSYKYPAAIANSILQLFGAADLYKSEFRRNEKKIMLAANYFPNDIMQEPYGKNINDLEIGEFTKYLIGWQATLEPAYHSLLTDKIVKF